MTLYSNTNITGDLVVKTKRVSFRPQGIDRVRVAVAALRGRTLTPPDAIPETLSIVGCYVGGRIRTEEEA